jgi:hypothetical protein
VHDHSGHAALLADVDGLPHQKTKSGIPPATSIALPVM